MKLVAPKTAEKYFEITEHSVRHLYEGLDSCWSYYKQALEHWDISQAGQPLTEENKRSYTKVLGAS